MLLESFIYGSSQGSIKGALLFDILIHDLFHLFGESLHNFADDNTLRRFHYDVSVLTKELFDDGT